VAFGVTLAIAMISDTLRLVSCYIRQIDQKDRDLDIPGKRVTMAKLQTMLIVFPPFYSLHARSATRINCSSFLDKRVSKEIARNAKTGQSILKFKIYQSQKIILQHKIAMFL
jgi:hypothetical protein